MEIRIREINSQNRMEIELVAERMRETLREVLGAERGTDYYTMEWLINRVLFHLDPAQCQAKVFVADWKDEMIGHCIVRTEQDDRGIPYGLFSTTYVLPEHRQQGLAAKFLQTGEAWFRSLGLQLAATNTGRHNSKLINLYKKYGYEVIYTNEEMLQLSKSI